MPRQKIIVKNVPDGIDGAPPWITTFVDMVSLLVTFFILLYTFSSIREFDAFTYPKNIMSTSGVIDGSASDTMERPAHDDLMLGMDLARGSRKRHTRPVNELRENMEEMGQALSEEHVPIDLRAAGDGLRVRFSDNAGFQPGSAEVEPALEKAPSPSSVTRPATTRSWSSSRGTPTTPSCRRPPSPTPTRCPSRGRAPRRTSSSSAVNSTRPWCSSRDTAPTGRARDAESALERRTNRRVEVRLVSISRCASRPCSRARSPWGCGR